MSGNSRIALVLALVLVGSLFMMPTPKADAAEGPVDQAGYFWTDSEAGDPRVEFDWVDIMSTGNDTGLTGDDTYGGPYDIGFDFRFYGNNYSQFYLSTNGYIKFGSGGDDRSNDPIPSSSSPNNIVAPYWDDLCVDYSVYNSGAIYYEMRGESPNRQLVIEFFEISRWVSYYLMTFEVILNETGDIWFQYDSMSGMTGSSATVGIENSDGSAGCEYSCDSSAITDGLAIRFSMLPIFVGPDQTATQDPDSVHDYTLTVHNNQPFEDTIEVTNSSELGWTVEVYDLSMVLLADTDSDLVPDTGPIPALSSVDIIVRVHVPAVPTDRVERTYLNASSSVLPSNYAVSTLTTICVPAQLTPPYEEYVEDSDMDSMHDFLGVNVTFDTLFSDDYFVYGYLYSPGWSYITGVSASAPGGPGSLVAYLEFPGEDIYRSEYDGPYNMYVYLYDGNGSIVDYTTSITAAYLWTDFERPAVIFTTPDSDYGVDTDGDSLFNYLVVNVTVDVAEEGSYRFTADLYGTLGTYVTYTSNITDVLTVGVHTIELAFPGVDIHDEGADGPYEAYIYVRDASYVYVNDHVYETGAYVWQDFQTRATLAPPYTDYGASTDANPLFDVLVVEVNVSVVVAGDFELGAMLYDGSMSAIESVVVTEYLSEGTGLFLVNFSGTDIRDHGADGPYTVYLTLFSDDTGYFLDDDSYLTGNYSLDEFQGPPVSYEPPHSDYGYDSNGNSLYDYLVVAVELNITVSGTYQLYGDLYDSGWSYIEGTSNETYLDMGIQTVELAFLGAPIRASGSSGAFNVGLYAYDASWTYWDYDEHVTSDYSYDEFETPVYLTPPHSDYGSDSNSNTLYDHLVVEVVAEVATGDTYYVYGDLYDSLSNWITGYSTTVTPSAGTNVFELYFSGVDISATETDGPYTVEIAVYDTGWSLLDHGSHTTSAYSWEEFEREPAELSPPYTDYGLDLNSDTLYDYLVVELYIDVAVAGEYEIDAYLFSPSWSTIDNQDMYVELSVGANTVLVYFSGMVIYEFGASGSFEVGFDFFDPAGSYLDTGWHTTGSYTWDEFSPPGAEFSTPHSDYGLDTNDDTLLNYLVVEASVEVSVAGTYEVYGEMYDWWGWFLTDASNELYLDVGSHSVELYFEGWAIYDSYEDGPYDVYLYLYSDDHEIDYDSYNTAYYSWDDFQTAPAWLVPPYSDHGLDTGSDMYYDYLVIEVPVETTEPGNCNVYVELYSGGSWVTDAATEVWLDAGLQVVEVLVDGWDIRGSGYDGPYDAYIYLYDDWWSLMDSDTHTTAAYSYDEFQPIPAVFGYPHLDTGVDEDGDDLYDALVVEASVDVALAGTFVVEAVLYDSWWNEIDRTEVEADLPAGSVTVDLSFDGWQVFASGTDGPYYIGMDLTRGDGSWLDYDSHTTEAYLYTEFTPEVPTMSSYWTDSPPVVDGEISEGEWSEAIPVGLVEIDPLNGLDAIVMVMNNGTQLYICLDVVGDTSEDDDDAASLSFDTGNDGIRTDGHEDQFVVCGPDWLWTGEAHYVYSSAWGDWITHCSPFDEMLALHDPLEGAMGFGPSDAEPSDHRIYEFSIRLDLLGTVPGDVLGFLVGSDDCYGVYDGSNSTYGSWPAAFEYAPGLGFYGDLILYSSSPPTTTCELSGTEGDGGWYLSSVEVSLTAEDEDEGVNRTVYRLDGGAWYNYTTPVTVTGSRTHVIEFFSVDEAGNSEAVRTVEIPIDTVAPSTVPVTGGTEGESGWFVTEVSLTFSASDNTGGSGVGSTRYRIDEGSWRAYSGSPVAMDSGVYVIEYYSIDAASNEESVGSLTLRVDADAPVTVATVSGSSVVLTASDSVSGVNRTMYRIDGGNWSVYDGEFEVEGSGNHTVEFYTVDEAGNEEATAVTWVEGSSGGIFGIPWWLLLLIIAVLCTAVALSVIFGMRRKARMRDPRAVMKGPQAGAAGEPPRPPQAGGEEGAEPPPRDGDVPPPPG